MRHEFGLEEAGPARVASAYSQALAGLNGRSLTATRLENRAVLSTPGSRFLFSAVQAATIIISSVAAGIGYHETMFGSAGSLPAFLSVGMLAGILYAAGMHIIDGTRRLRDPNGREALGDASLTWIGVLLLVIFVVFSLKTGDALSRGAIMCFSVIGYGAVLLTRSIAPRLIAAQAKSTRRTADDILVVGVKGHPALLRLLSELGDSGRTRLSAVELSANCSDAEWEANLPLSLGRIYALARMNAHGDICIAAGGLSESRLRDITDAVRVIPRAVCVVPDPSVETLLHLPIRSIGELHCVELQRSPMNVAQRAVKRCIDLAIAIPLFLFISPLLLAAALAIKMSSNGPILFRQRRLGYRGRTFAILKFRTMTVLEDGAEVPQARKNDARVTRVGAWLRKTSIDELPQLINVIRGEMSLVGPRPHAVAHDQFYTKLIEHYEVRQHVKPGITGWAQVNGLRGETKSVDSMRQRVEFDMWYAKNASIWFDIKILMLTIVEVLRQRNAY